MSLQKAVHASTSHGHALRGAAKSVLLNGFQNEHIDPRQWRRLVMEQGATNRSNFIASVDCGNTAAALTTTALRKLSLLAHVADTWEGALRIASLSVRLSSASTPAPAAVGFSRRTTLRVLRLLLQAGKGQEALRLVHHNTRTAPQRLQQAVLSPKQRRTEKTAFRGLIRELATIEDARSLKALLEALTGACGPAQHNKANVVRSALGPSAALDVATCTTLALLRLPDACLSKMERASAVLSLASIAPDGALPPVVRALWDQSHTNPTTPEASPTRLPKRLIAALDTTAATLAFRSWCTLSTPLALLDCPTRWLAEELRNVHQRYGKLAAHPMQRLGLTVAAQRPPIALASLGSVEGSVEGGADDVKASHTLAAVFWLRAPTQCKRLSVRLGDAVLPSAQRLERIARDFMLQALHDPAWSMRAARCLFANHGAVARRLGIRRRDAVLHLLDHRLREGSAPLLHMHDAGSCGLTTRGAVVFRRMYAETLLRCCSAQHRRPVERHGTAPLQHEPYRYLMLIKAGLSVGVLGADVGSRRPATKASYRRLQRGLLEAASGILDARTLLREDRVAVVGLLAQELLDSKCPAVLAMLTELPACTVVGLGTALHDAGLPFADVRNIMLAAGGRHPSMHGDALLDLVRLCSRRHYRKVGLVHQKKQGVLPELPHGPHYPSYREPSRSAMLALQSTMRRMCRDTVPLQRTPSRTAALTALFDNFICDPPAMRYAVQGAAGNCTMTNAAGNLSITNGPSKQPTTANPAASGTIDHSFVPTSIEASLRCMHALSMLANVSDAVLLKEALTALHALTPRSATALLRAEGLM